MFIFRHKFSILTILILRYLEGFINIDWFEHSEKHLNSTEQSKSNKLNELNFYQTVIPF